MSILTTKFSEINFQKNIFVICHPRSGSTWFCGSFKNHFNFHELFTPTMDIVSINDIEVIYSKPCTNFNTVDYKNFIQSRIQIFEKYKKENSAVKIFMKDCLNFDINLFLNNQLNNSVFLLLERKNKFNVFMSHVISQTLNVWGNRQYDKNLLPKNIYVSNTTVNRVLSGIQLFESNKNQIKNTFNALNFYYEDLINEPENEWWSPIYNIKMVEITNLKKQITLINKDEIIQTILNSNCFYKHEIADNLISYYN